MSWPHEITLAATLEREDGSFGHYALRGTTARGTEVVSGSAVVGPAR